MATVTLPTRYDGTQRYAFRANIGGGIFAFEFFWNDRDQSWSFTLSDTSGNLLAARKVVLNTPLLWRLQGSLALPKGELFAVDTSGQNAEPGLNDLGTRVLLTFMDVADFRP